ncbi:unnamed protein product [Urochloa humidicola]
MGERNLGLVDHGWRISCSGCFLDQFYVDRADSHGLEHTHFDEVGGLCRFSYKLITFTTSLFLQFGLTSKSS